LAKKPVMAFAEQQKARGDRAYKRRDWKTAEEAYTQALKLNPEDEIVHRLYSNRSAVRIQLRDMAGAEKDARECTRLRPAWPKGWERLGKALTETQPNKAIEAFQKALELDPFNDNAQAKLDNLLNTNTSSRNNFTNTSNNQPRFNNNNNDNHSNNYNDTSANQHNYNNQQQQQQYGNQTDPITQFTDWWQSLPTETRNIVVVGIIFAVLFLYLARSGGMGFDLQNSGMFGLMLIMGALWKIPPMFGGRPFFGMSPWTMLWLVRMFMSNNRGRRRNNRGYGGYGRMGGFGRPRRGFF